MNILQQFKQVTTLVFGMDGVLTDGKFLILENGEALRQLHVKDGFALQLAVKKGYRLIFISRGFANGIRISLNKGGIHDVFLGVENKLEKLGELVEQHELNWTEILFMGHDIPDYACLKMAGMSCSPDDAPDEIKHISKYVSPFKGGEGCVRDVIEKVLKLNGHWEFDPHVPSS